MALVHESRKNQLIAGLTEADWQRWLPDLEPVELPVGKVLYEPGTTLTHVYFPTTALVSLQYVTEGGAPSGSAIVGTEHCRRRDHRLGNRRDHRVWPHR